MVLKSKLLEAVVSAPRGAMHIKGDTTGSMPTASTCTREATVAGLAENAPGIQVDRTARSSAEGRYRQKVLVDGEEFFGDDPTLVTQNLRADRWTGCRSTHKKSDQATFTGIDDGVRDKTINLKAQRQHKRTVTSGRITAGVGRTGLRRGADGQLTSKREGKVAATASVQYR